MLPFLKKKTPVEQVAHRLIHQSLPHAYEFYEKENRHARTPLVIDEKPMREVGAGICLFYLVEFLPDTKAGNQARMGRIYNQMKKDLRPLNANPQKAYDAWKAFTDALILHQNLSRIDIATRLSWERLLPERKYVDQTPLRSYCYYLKLQVDDVKKLRLS